MRITIVTGPFYSPPPAQGGAVERRWFHVAREFRRVGHEVEFLSRRVQGQEPEEILDGVRHRRRLGLKATRFFPLNLAKDFVYSMRLLPMLGRSDILVTNAFWLPALKPFLARRAGRLVINVARVPKGQLTLYRGAALVVAPSRAVEEIIRHQAPFLADHSVTVPNPIDTEVFRPSPHFPDDEPSVPTILYAGRVHPEKGLELLARAHRQLKEAIPALTTRIIGPWRVEDGGAGGAFRESLVNIGGEGIEMGEAIYDRETFAEAIRQATVFCYPSVAEQGESFGCAPLEAMGCGRATVVSNLPPFREYLRDGENGACFDHTGEGAATRLAATLKGLLDDTGRRHSMARAAAATAGTYSFESIARQYLNHFEALMTGGSP